MASLTSTYTAEEKAEHADADSIIMLPVSALLMLAIIFAFLGWIGFHYGSTDHPLVGMLLMSWIGAVEFAGFALWKWDRDRFWRALDVINSLDLRRQPAE